MIIFNLTGISLSAIIKPGCVVAWPIIVDYGYEVPDSAVSAPAADATAMYSLCSVGTFGPRLSLRIP